MFNVRRVFASWAAVATLLTLLGRAEAQTAVTVTIPTTGVQRDHQDGGGKVPITQINYRDCVAEDFLTFTVNLGAGYSGYALEAWAGTSCDTLPARTPATATCWQVTTAQPNNIVYSFDVPIRKLLSGRTGGTSIGTTTGTGGADATGGNAGSSGTDTAAGTGGTAGIGGDVGTGGTAGTTATVSDGPTACNPTSAATGPQPLSLYIMLLDGANTSQGFAIWKATYKLLAPPPPTGVTSGIGENIAPIRWTPSTTTVDSTINGYQFYCDPPPGSAAATEAGFTPEDGILPSSCLESTALVEGKRPDDKYKCGNAEKTSSRGNATGLIDNVPYNVAVAATDTYRNTGIISAPACAIPQPVTGFFEAYRNAGGEAGGGFCSFSLRRQPLPLIVLLGLGTCLVLRRRRAA